MVLVESWYRAEVPCLVLSRPRPRTRNWTRRSSIHENPIHSLSTWIRYRLSTRPLFIASKRYRPLDSSQPCHWRRNAFLLSSCLLSPALDSHSLRNASRGWAWRAEPFRAALRPNPGRMGPREPQQATTQAALAERQGRGWQGLASNWQGMPAHHRHSHRCMRREASLTEG